MDALAVVSLIATIVLGIAGYLLAQRDNQRQSDIAGVQALIKETASLVLSEKDKTAALVLTESKSTAALVLTERDRLAAQVKLEHDVLDEKLVAFRIKVAEEYTTTVLIEKLLKPITQQLNDIERLLHTKVDRKELEFHRGKPE